MSLHQVRPISPDTLDDLRKLLQMPPEGWCWCVAWEVPTWEGWAQRTATENQSLREALWARGEFYGYVFYLNQEPVGWCRVGPTTVWPKLCQQRGLNESETDYVFSCFGLRPEHRGRGHLHVFLEKVLTDLEGRGVTKVLAIPKVFSGVPDPGHVWNGPKSIFLKAGFSSERTGSGFEIMKLCFPRNAEESLS